MAKIIASVVTFLANIGIAAAVFIFMLIIMNGFSGSDASWGIWAYILLVALITLLMTVAAGFSAHRLGKREMHPAVVTLISAGIFSAIGGVLMCVSGFVGVVLADVVRRNF